MTEGAGTDPPRGTPRVSAVVLAAGLATRMGRPKSLVTVSGRPLLAHLLDRVTRSRVSEVLVVLGHDADLVQSAVDLRAARVVLNPEYRQGMSSSIRAGLHAADPAAGAYLMLLGDQPFVESGTLDRMIEAWVRGGGGILIPTFRGRRGNPVLLDRALAPEADALRGDVGFRGLFEPHTRDLREVPVDDPGILFDVDTPEQLNALETRLAKGVPLRDALEEIVGVELARRDPP